MAESYVVKVEGGQAKLYSVQTKGFRGATSSVYKAVHAVLMGDEIHVTCADGKVRIFHLNCNLKAIV